MNKIKLAAVVFATLVAGCSTAAQQTSAFAVVSAWDQAEKGATAYVKANPNDAATKAAISKAEADGDPAINALETGGNNVAADKLAAAQLAVAALVNAVAANGVK